MKAIIPTAGMGKRLRPFTHSLPKVLLQVADKPIIGHIIDMMVDNGVGEITFVIGYLGDKIESYVKRNYPDLKTNFVEQPEAKGLGHAIYLTKDLHQDCDEPLLIVLGDTIIEADLSVLNEAETDLIGVREVADPRRFGVVEMNGGLISRMVEKPDKPKSNLAIVGIYYLKNPSLLFECLEENIQRKVLTKGEFQVTDAFQGMIEKGNKMGTLQVDGWHDCGTSESLLSTNQNLLRDRFPDMPGDIANCFPTVHFKPPVYVSPTAEITDCIVGPYVAVGNHVKLNRTIIRNSILNEGADVDGCVLEDSIIGCDALVRGAAHRMRIGDKSTVISD